MSRTAHIIGNGDSYRFYKHAPGIKMTCNLPPMAVKDTYATAIVDFKMCKAMHEGSVDLRAYDWVMGARPKKYTEMQPNFYMRFARNIKEFYTVLPKYVKNYTDFNCGHMGTHYIANKLNCDEIHMYGFDSIFDFNLVSTTDFVLNANRDAFNTHRLAQNWRPIWEGLFREFPNTQFVVYHAHGAAKVSLPKNVEVRTGLLK
tara:strand:+ start:160 stop:765 length:606 start_codon:yes stop_codon:yes gene_type:complete